MLVTWLIQTINKYPVKHSFNNSDENNHVLESYKHHASAYIIKLADFDKFREFVRIFDYFWLNKAILPKIKDDLNG